MKLLLRLSLCLKRKKDEENVDGKSTLDGR